MPLLIAPPLSEVSRLNLRCKSSIFATKTTAFVGFVVFDLWLRHKSYKRVGRQTIYSTKLDQSPSDVPRALMRWKQFRWVLPRISCAVVRLHVPSHACWHHCWYHSTMSALAASSADIIFATSRWHHQLALSLTSSPAWLWPLAIDSIKHWLWLL